VLKRLGRAGSLFRLFSLYLPDDSSKKVSALYYPRKLLGSRQGRATVLDLGCGAGNSLDAFREINPQITWCGVDVEGSPERSAGRRTEAPVKLYDGVNLPYEDAFFDFIYTNQVLEHVRYPDRLLESVFRVLKPGGYFAGSVSYLEPYHSFSIFNFTPYGLAAVLGDAGLRIVEMRPGSDCLSVISRQMLNAPGFLNPFFENVSPVYALISLCAAMLRLGTRERNFLKLQFAGHICFLAVK